MGYGRLEGGFEDTIVWLGTVARSELGIWRQADGTVPVHSGEVSFTFPLGLR